MKKSKKDKPRPRWYCTKCGSIWVSAEKKYIDCILCGTAGEPLNESAEKMIRKTNDEKIV